MHQPLVIATCASYCSYRTTRSTQLKKKFNRKLVASFPGVTINIKQNLIIIVAVNQTLRKEKLNGDRTITEKSHEEG